VIELGESRGRDLSALVVPRSGRLVTTGDDREPFRVIGPDEEVLDPVSVFLRDLLASGKSAAGRYGDVYLVADARVRRLSNQAIFEKLLIEPRDDGPAVTGAVLREPYASLAGATFRQAAAGGAPSPDQTTSATILIQQGILSVAEVRKRSIW
jgi:hypothetical protein